MKPSVNNTPSAEDLELINNYARNPLSAEEVYCFTLTLCDNEIDRDFERFSLEALSSLEKLFVGKTGIADHNMSTSNQTARIFRTWLEENPEKKTTVGESYVALKAKAYMLITEENKNMIEQIEGGIKKEVSVGCSMGNMTCSVCKKDMKNHECKHIKGKHYGKKLCHGILENAKDAYEWSFVAVPAQKNAGVTKAFATEQTEKNVSEHNYTLQDDEGIFPCKYVKSLETKAHDGELYKSFLTAEIRKYALIAMNRVNIDAFMAHCDHMNSDELKSLMESLKDQASQIIPVTLQLKSLPHRKNETNNNSFKI